MECLEAALKSSFGKDMALKLSPKEELSALTVQNVVASCDDFFVDDLLDFSLLENEEPEQHNDDTASVSPQNKNQEIYNFSPSLNNDNFSSELTVPAEEVADLEWLSHFVEDSFYEHAPSFPVPATESKETAPEPGNAGFTFKTPVPGRARSKRTRTGVRVWPQRSPSFTDTSSTSTTSSSSSSSSSPSPAPASPLLICAAAIKGPDVRPKKRWAAEGGGAARRCSHCGVQKTPQWRTGPLGAKTLCNACGVRFKSGRLLPEYRPACSPTYSSELHSNHHRKVLEMRRKKEESDGPVSGSGSGSAPSVLDF